jgi:hypothetical protein
VLPGLQPSQVNTLTTLVLQNPSIEEPTSFPNLQNITLYGDKCFPDNLYNLRSCSSLSSLTLALCTAEESRRKDDIIVILGWFPQITKVSVDYWHFDVPYNDAQFFNPPVKLPAVDSLGLFVHGRPKSLGVLGVVFRTFYKAGIVTLRMPETDCLLLAFR